MRIGDVVEFSNNDAVHKATVTAVTDNFNFNITRLGSTTLADGALTSPVIRTRPEIKEASKKKLLTPLGYPAVKNTNNNNTQNPAGYVLELVLAQLLTVVKHLQMQEQDYYGKMVLIMMTFQVVITSSGSGTGDGDVLSSGAGFSISGTSANTQILH